MEAAQKEKWYIMVLVFSLALLRVSEQQKDAVGTVVLEDGMVLDCVCPWHGTFSMVSWTKEGESNPLAVFHPDFGVNFSRLYDGRVKFLRASSLDGSVSISRVSERDLGRYHCSMQTFPSGSWIRDILVEKRVTTTSPAPLVPKPKNRTLTLSCDHVRGGVLYEVSVEKVYGAGGESRVLAVCSLKDGEVTISKYLDSGSVNCSDNLDMTLHLDATGGYKDGEVFRCNFSTDAGVYSTTDLLPLSPNQDFRHDSNRLWMFIGGGGAGVLLILMCVALFCIWLHRRMESRVEYSNHSQLTKKQPQQQRECHKQARVYDRMKATRHQKTSPIYANIQTAQALRNGK